MSLLPALACLVTARPGLPPPCHDALIPPISPLPTRENIQKSTYLHTYTQTQPFSHSRRGQKLGVTGAHTYTAAAEQTVRQVPRKTDRRIGRQEARQRDERGETNVTAEQSESINSNPNSNSISKQYPTNQTDPYYTHITHYHH